MSAQHLERVGHCTGIIESPQTIMVMSRNDCDEPHCAPLSLAPQLVENDTTSFIYDTSKRIRAIYAFRGSVCQGHEAEYGLVVTQFGMFCMTYWLAFGVL
jgi:hypothetical protein